MTALAAIHVAKKQLGLDDDTYRALLTRVTGKSSSAAMTEPERQRVIEELRRQGFKPALKAGPKAVRKPLQGPYAKKLQALWISGWNLGLVADRTDAALIAFVKRQTGIDHVTFLRDPAEARKVIEALKGWMSRGAGVVWPKGIEGGPAWQLAVIDAQLRLLGDDAQRDAYARDESAVSLMRRLGARIRNRLNK